MRAGASPRFATRPCRNSRTPTAARTHIALRFGAPAEHRRGIVEPHRRIARFAMRPCRRNRRTPTTVQAHIALRTVTRSPVSPPNTAAESAERTNAPINAHGRIAPLCHAATPPRQANADRLERTRPSTCARAHRPALPRGHAETDRRGRRTPTTARAHIALRTATRFGAPAEHRSGIGGTHGRIAPLRHAAMPKQTAATGERRPARANAHRPARRDALPCLPAEYRRGIGEPHRRIARFAMRPCRRNRRTPTGSSERGLRYAHRRIARFTTRPSRNRPPRQAKTDRLAQTSAAFNAPRARHLRFATRPCRRGRRTPTIARAHIALRFGAPLSPRRTPQRNRRNGLRGRRVCPF